MSAEKDKPKGGHLARNAALLCQDGQFRLYLDRRRAAKFNLEIPDGTHTVEDARDFVIAACGISSRAELDHSQDAASVFQSIMHHYLRWHSRQRRRAGQSP